MAPKNGGNKPPRPTNRLVVRRPVGAQTGVSTQGTGKKAFPYYAPPAPKSASPGEKGTDEKGKVRMVIHRMRKSDAPRKEETGKSAFLKIPPAPPLHKFEPQIKRDERIRPTSIPMDVAPVRRMPPPPPPGKARKSPARPPPPPPKHQLVRAERSPLEDLPKPRESNPLYMQMPARPKAISSTSRVATPIASSNLPSLNPATNKWEDASKLLLDFDDDAPTIAIQRARISGTFLFPEENVGAIPPESIKRAMKGSRMRKLYGLMDSLQGGLEQLDRDLRQEAKKAWDGHLAPHTALVLGKAKNFLHKRIEPAVDAFFRMLEKFVDKILFGAKKG